MNLLMNKQRAFLFQGVGPQYQDLLDRFDNVQLQSLKRYASIVLEEIGVDLYGYLMKHQDMECDSMFYDWIAIYTCDYIIYQQFIDSGVRPAVMLGYSMGLITAMACAKSISFADGLRMLQTIYEYPKDSSDSYGMGVIVGQTYKEVYQLIVDCKAENEVFIASENNDTCLVVSGIKDSIHQVLKRAEEEGAIKASLINTPYAFHSPYAARGINMFVDLVETIPIREAEVPILSVFTQTFIQSAPDLKNELIKNMASPMNWNASILKLGESEIDSFVEVSLDDSLTKISRIINLDNEFLTYKKFQRLEKAL
ncbi:ACP S-malonyltransferase [Paenibacillus massiliensis]|uniref:ACP S-malonyltransferase n=1 Tax=Paenibacillus massiliensis TaxID=225917 RepID=UPI0004080311|nr:ACP S-malonyltransferase [Paenibacillus massiliensis]